MSKPTVNSKQLFGQFLGNSLAVMLLIDPETRRVVDANPTAEKFYGWNHAQLTAICIDQINTLSTAEIKVEMEKARNQQRSYFKFRHRKADGSVSPVEVFTSNVEINGKAYLHTIVHDITGQVEADFKLHETNEYLENLFTYANAPIIVWDNLLMITRFNRAFELLSGYSANEVIGKHIELLFPPKMKDKYLRFIKETTAGNRWETIEIEIQRNDGTIRTVIWNSANILDSSKQKIIATIAQGQDITDWVAFQKQLEESEEKYRYLFVNNPLPMWIYDLGSLCFLEVNNAAIKHYGYSKVEFLSMTLKDIRPAEDLPMFLDDVKNTINNYNQAGVWRHVKKNGEIFQVEIASHKVDYEGRAARLVLISDVTQRQKAENRLKHSHDLMSYIIEHDRSAIAVHDRDLNYIYVSQRYLEQYNVQEKDIIGKHHYEVFPDLPQKWRDVHKKALKGEVSSAEDDVYPKEDGTLVYTRWECRPWYEADGSIGGIVVYTEVINDRIEKELEIKKLNHRLEILVLSVQELSSVQSVEQVQNIIVTSARKLLGADGATIIFKEKDQCFYAAEDAISPLWSGKRFPMEACVSGWAMQNKKPLVIDNIYNDKRVPIEAYRTTFVKSLAMVPINLNAPLGAIGTYWKNNYKPTEVEVSLLQTLADSAARALENIGLLNQLEKKVAELAHSEAIKTKMVANIGDVIVIIDRNNINQYKSPNIETLFGWKPEELIGQNTWDIIHPDDVQRGRQFLDKLAIAHGSTGTIELRYKRKDGKYVWIEVTVANLLNDSVINGYLGNYHDISDRKKDQQELIKAKDRAEESDRLKSAFLANMSHEIRTPLNSIMGFASLLPDEDMKEVMAQYANIIYRNSEQLVSIIDGIVLYSKLQAKQMVCNRATFDLNSYLFNTFSSFNHIDYHGNVEFKLKIDMTREMKVETDQEKLKQIITSLLSNAYKFTQKGEISLGYIMKNDNIEFYVSDTGIGISKKEIAHVFDRFFRASNINESTTRGTGIGLSIAREMAELLGGKIWAESVEGKGSTFYFSILLNLKINVQA